MNKGPHYVHQTLRNELIQYLKSQYLGSSELLLEACAEQMEEPGNLWAPPYIESSPAYESVENGIATADIPENIRKLFLKMSEAGLGVFQTPFRHQVEALEAACKGKDLFVSTGTGSGKTECFMWPLVARLVSEAASSLDWRQRGVRVIVMYPMNALVADQIGRLRRMLGDPQGKFIRAFREIVGSDARRPQFGMYTGRTPYSGTEPHKDQDKALADSLMHLLPEGEDDSYYEQLLKGGKIPAKKNLEEYINQIKAGNHVTSDEDAEMITRFEMQRCCPDILITNYSMLEYMLIREREDSIWDSTRKHFAEHPDEKLLFIIDEAHMYRGSAGGEVALQIHRLMTRLGITRDRIQFILTTASMPHETPEDDAAVMQFAGDLTGTLHPEQFVYLRGHKGKREGSDHLDLSCDALCGVDIDRFEKDEKSRLEELNHFIGDILGKRRFESIEQASAWLYDHLPDYVPFQHMMEACRGNAVAMDELAADVFQGEEKALQAMDAMLTIAPMAHDADGNVLFPARMHMMFRGFTGVYACLNPECPKGHEKNGLKIGEVFLNDRHLICPYCRKRVYELYTDRRCGALFIHGYVSDVAGRQYLWNNEGAFFDAGKLKDLYFYLPMDGDELTPYKKRNAKQLRCWLDLNSGFISFSDVEESSGDYRELWYSIPAKPRKDNPDLFVFGTCPKCKSKFSFSSIASFSTRGNEPFYNVIQSQFQVQPAASKKKEGDEHLPNEGRKVLLFSDSRQKAAKLARDMSISSDNMAIRKLFMIALKELTEAKQDADGDAVLEEIYSYIVKAADNQNLDLFSGESRDVFRTAREKYRRSARINTERGKKGFRHEKLEEAPQEMLEHLLRLFCMPYNTLTDNGLCFLEPETETMYEALDLLEEKGFRVSETEFKEVFSAVIRYFLVDIAISEYAPGRSIVVDKKTYIIGGLYVHQGRQFNFKQTSDYLHDPNYTKDLKHCTHCGWFGYAKELEKEECPFCGTSSLEPLPPMVRPWGFSPKDNKPEAANVVDEYSTTQSPLYSTLPDESGMEDVKGYKSVRKAVREDQRIIILNRGSEGKGFTICSKCGAVVPGDDASDLRGRKRPGNVVRAMCNHSETMNIILGYDFLTDMLVLTFRLPKTEVETQTPDAITWLDRAGTTLAEALRKASAIQMDIEYDEIQAGYRVRDNEKETCVDVYLYDSLSSGAGYSTQMGVMAEELLAKAKEILENCSCEHACQKCLKHYRNQFVQARLDRFAALELLEYGKTMRMPDIIEGAEAYELIAPMKRLLNYEGVELDVDHDAAILKRKGNAKVGVVFPAMMRYDKHKWNNKQYVCVTKEALKDAKPYALKQIMDTVKQ